MEMNKYRVMLNTRFFSRIHSMRKIFYITFVAFLVQFSSEALAQGQKEKTNSGFDREAFEAKRNAYITAEVGLTPEEAEVFIPLCTEMRQKLFEVGRSGRKLSRQMHKKKQPTDADYLQVIDAELEIKFKEAQIERDYYEQFKKVISPEKLYKYRIAEMTFLRNFMKKREGKQK